MSATRLRDYFRSELRDYGAQLATLVRSDESMESPGELLRLARAVRGTSHLAGEDALFRVAAALERAARALVDEDLAWSTDIRERVERTLVDITVILGDSESGDALAGRVEATEERWRALGLDEPRKTAGPVAETGALDDEAFLSFAAREIDGIVTVLGEISDTLDTEAADRDAMHAILRRQRALLGTARLDDLPAVAETLHAIDDVCGIIARMDVAIKDEWLEVFRCARMVLEASAGSVARGEDTPHTPALSRLRTYRQELLERYGAGEHTSAHVNFAASGPVPTAAAEAPPEGSTPEVTVETGGSDALDIQNLMYTGEAALRRALGLRARLEQAVEHDPDALALVDEVFDLIRLGLQ